MLSLTQVSLRQRPRGGIESRDAGRNKVLNFLNTCVFFPCKYVFISVGICGHRHLFFRENKLGPADMLEGPRKANKSAASLMSSARKCL
jgi:hypothetical protein